MSELIIDYITRLAISLACGFCLGLERKMRQHTVGIRTLTLICVSSCLLTIVSVSLADAGIITGDPTRVAAAVITGIGFLGAGAIVNQGLNIRGLTSAAIIFTAAALGVACGARLYIPVAVVLVFSIILLLIIGRMEKRLFPADKRKCIKIDFKNSDVEEPAIRKILEDNGIVILEVNSTYEVESEKLSLIYVGKIPASLDTLVLTKKLSSLPQAAFVSIDS